MNLSHNSPYPIRLWAYLQQRFPIQNAVLFFILFLSTQIFADFINGQTAFSFGIQQILGFIAVYFFFFVLRVFDEHKDYEIDCLNHPQRVLQQGLVKLHHLKYIAIFAVIYQALYSWWLSPITFVFWCIAFVFALFMAKDFFIGEYLHKHLFVMMFTHSPVTPLAIIWMMAMTGIMTFSLLTVTFILTCLSCGIAFEISRKIKTPEDEVKTVDSYSQVAGFKWASLYSLSALIISTILLSYILYAIEVAIYLLVLPSILLIICSYVYFNFIKSPTAKKAKLIEVSASLYMLFIYVILLAVLISKMDWLWIF